MHDIVCVGSSTEDVFVNVSQMKLISVRDKDADDSYLAFEYGGKVPVDEIFIATGGGATNCAVGFARLGLQVGIISSLGDDDAAMRIIEKLNRENVDTEMLVHNAMATTGYSVILTCFTGDRTVLVHRGASTLLREDQVDWDALAEAKWIYLSSMAGESASLFTKIAVFAAEHDIKLALNPGGTQLHQGLKELAPAFEACHVLFVNKREAYGLTNTEERAGHGDEMQALQGLYDAGCDIVVMTLGPEGCEAYDGTAHYTVPVVEANEKSTLGAGDAFAAGCTAALFRGVELREALRAGSINAASVTEYLGAKRGLLHCDEMNARLEAYGCQTS